MYLFTDFINLAFELYNKIIKGTISLEKVLDLINFPSNITKCYRKEMDKIISKQLSFYDDDISLLRELEKVCLYEEAMGRFTCFYLFRIWHQNISFSAEEIAKLIEAIFMGCIGYRLIDLCNDEKDVVREEVRFLGYDMIQKHELLLVDVFPKKKAFNAIKKHAATYYRIEYLEKKNKWKTCPFTYENIGKKASPLFAVMELIILFQDGNKEKIEEMNEAFIYLAAGIQMIDDFCDAKEDLNYGFETPAMFGFYTEMGKDDITDKKIQKFLTPQKLKQFFSTTENLFEKAREIFLKHNELVMSILLESHLHSFYQLINFTESKKKVDDIN